MPKLGRMSYCPPGLGHDLPLPLPLLLVRLRRVVECEDHEGAHGRTP